MRGSPLGDMEEGGGMDCGLLGAEEEEGEARLVSATPSAIREADMGRSGSNGGGREPLAKGEHSSSSAAALSAAAAGSEEAAVPPEVEVEVVAAADCGRSSVAAAAAAPPWLVGLVGGREPPHPPFAPTAVAAPSPPAAGSSAAEERGIDAAATGFTAWSEATRVSRALYRKRMSS